MKILTIKDVRLSREGTMLCAAPLRYVSQHTDALGRIVKPPKVKADWSLIARHINRARRAEYERSLESQSEPRHWNAPRRRLGTFREEWGGPWTGSLALVGPDHHRHVCRTCGTPFVSLTRFGAASRYCSAKCRVRPSAAKERIPKACVVCAKTFVPTRKDAITCSLKCRVARYRRAHATERSKGKPR
jgi:hypothetical protein